jgi:hypothetical protein
MEKQLCIFKEEVKEDSKVWCNIPESSQNKIETGFVNLLIRFLCQSIEETVKNEN